MFEGFKSETTFTDLGQEIKKLKEENKILQNSFDFLSKKILEFKDNGNLDKHEIKFIEEQIGFHKQLKKLKEEFEYKKGKLSNKSKEKLSNIFKEKGSFTMGESEINYIDSETSKEFMKTKDTLPLGKSSIRDIVESSIDFKYIPESLLGIDSVNELYDIFTIKYLNFIEGNMIQQDIFKKHQYNKGVLIITGLEVKDILKEIFKSNKGLRELDKKIKVNCSSGNIDINLKTLIEEVENDEIKQEKARKVKELILAEEREIKKKKDILLEVIKNSYELKSTTHKISQITPLKKDSEIGDTISRLIIYLIETGTLNYKECEEIVGKLYNFNHIDFSNNFQDKQILEKRKNENKEKKYSISLLETLIEDINDLENTNLKCSEYTENTQKGNSKHEKYVHFMLNNFSITKKELLEISSNQDRFNYLQFIEEYGLPDEVLDTYIDLILLKMVNQKIYLGGGKVITLTKKFIEENKGNILNNLKVLNKLIVGIESDGWNVDNNAGSGAMGLFQFHTKNGNRETGNYHSFDTALRRSYDYYVDKQIVKIKNGISDSKQEGLIIRMEEITPKTAGRIQEQNPNISKQEYLIKLLEALKINKPKQSLLNIGNNIIPGWIIASYNTQIINPKDLSPNKQNELFIIDAMYNGRKVINGLGHKKGVKDYIGLAIVGNVWSTEKFYELFHHTAPDEATKKRITTYSKKYNKEFIKID